MKFTRLCRVLPLPLAASLLLLPGAASAQNSRLKTATTAKAGAAAVSVTPDGDVTDWKGIEPVMTAPAKGSQPCDWRKLFLARNDASLFVRYTTEGAVDFTKGAAYMVFLDTDQNKESGFRGSGGEFSIGANFLLQGTTLYKYNGTGTDWAWESLGAVPSGSRQNEAEFALSREMLGKPTAVDIILYGDNEAAGVEGKILNVVPDGALTGTAKITYSLK